MRTIAPTATIPAIPAPATATPAVDFRNHPFQETHQIPLARPWFGEEEADAAAQVVRSGMLCQGAKTAEFERAFARRFGAKHAIAVSSGSTALLVALQAMGIQAGDEVIVPDMTFVSTATAAMYLGAKPVLVDITLDDYNLDPERIERFITGRTKAIVPVHYAGQTADMGPILDIARRHRLYVLEDSAEAHLAQYRGGPYAGTLGDAGIFSFTPTKPMTTGEGGMIVSENDDLAERCRTIRNFGDEGKFTWTSLGFNFRINEVAAAIGLVQLGKLDSIVAQRRRKAAFYDQALAGEEAIITPHVRQVADCNYQLYTVRFRTECLRAARNDILDALAQRGISTRLYYPALHRMGVFAPLGPYDDGQFPNTLAFQDSALSLPIFTGLTHQQQAYVAEALLDCVRSMKR